MNGQYIVLFFFALFGNSAISLPMNRKLYELSRRKRAKSYRCDLLIDGKYYDQELTDTIDAFDSGNSSFAWFCLEGDVITDIDRNLKSVSVVIAYEDDEGTYRPLRISNGELELSEKYLKFIELKSLANNKKCDVELSLAKNPMSGTHILKSCSSEFKMKDRKLEYSYQASIDVY